MLRAASAAMSMSPHNAMVVAERLYTGGFISYPRTESSRYPPSFDGAQSSLHLGRFGDGETTALHWVCQCSFSDYRRATLCPHDLVVKAY